MPLYLFRKSALLLFWPLLWACVEPFEPEDVDFRSVLVVDGFVSNSSETSIITLGRTASLETAEMIPEQGADVTVADDLGGVYCFMETKPGVYQSDTAVFTGRIGGRYQLSIVRASGHHYLSDTVALKQSPPIDSLYFEREMRLTDVAGVVEDGISIYVDAHDATGQTRYYRYDYIETHEVKLTYPGDWVFDNQQGAYRLKVPRLGVCYSSRRGSDILVANTSTLAEDRVKKLEIAYVATGDYRLSGLYSILVRQYALDERAYRYWYELQKTSESLGTLFDPQPYELQGNIRNVADPDEAVLGYFGAGAVSEKRLFADKKDLIAMGVYYPRDPCIAELDTPKNRQEFELFTSWGHLIAIIEPDIFISPECGDCRYYGTLEKPGFWPR